MKKFRFIMAILLALTMALASCGGADVSPTVTPRTVEGLFDAVKSFEVGQLRAEVYDNNGYHQIGNYCFQHKAWEPYSDATGTRHGESFRLDDAQGISGWAILRAADYTPASSAVAAVKDLTKVLKSFYTDEYKLTWPPYKTGTGGFPDGTPLIAWVSYHLKRDGLGACGYSADPTAAPCWKFWYQF